MSILERILHIRKHSGLSTRQFEFKIGKSNGYINQLKKRGSSPAADVISKIIESYPEYNLQWLMTGEGDMYSKNVDLSSEPAAKYQDKKSIDQIVDERIDIRIKSELENYKSTLIQLIIDELDKEIIASNKKLKKP
ncbi:helix-turn-helix domain-containing protein [Abyssalbus ytuae]|uniref:Helix-turn-helix domain-containing protein n=1 Tax=Abyssalbus ytuae TaxID=2926907 RepID=A0A9E7D126_9FLAO|nr:helix-turn-helix domain-containing protein [Abyssalbus ytuae]UOB16613.1 helix-turn-helix domain-containing protein [Abyssalbus ytuae]